MNTSGSPDRQADQVQRHAQCAAAGQLGGGGSGSGEQVVAAIEDRHQRFRFTTAPARTR